MSTEQEKALGLKDHWKAIIAMTLVSLSSFQYGLDFGIIGGLQAMVPFLEVSMRVLEREKENGKMVVSHALFSRSLGKKTRQSRSDGISLPTDNS